MENDYARVEVWNLIQNSLPYTTRSLFTPAINTIRDLTFDISDASNVFYHLNVAHSRCNAIGYGISYKVTAETGWDIRVAAETNGNLIKFGTKNDQYWARSSDAIYHEYFHTVINSIYGGPINNGTVEAKSMDEGLSDYFACSINNDPFYTEDVNDTRYLSNTYSFDPNWNSHLNGQVIGGACWDLYSNIGGIANNLVMYALNCSPKAHNYVDFEYNMILVDAILLAGTHQSQIRQAFLNHGICWDCSGTLPPAPKSIDITDLNNNSLLNTNKINNIPSSYFFKSKLPQSFQSFHNNFILSSRRNFCQIINI